MGPILAIPEAFLKKQGIKNPKVVIYGTIAIVLGITAFVVIRKIRQSNAGKYTSGRSFEEMSEEISSISITKSRLTITEGQAVIIAQNLLAAMNRIGTDVDAVIDNISMAKTKEDLLLITQKFGIKPYDGWGLADTWLSRQVASTMKNLAGWIRAEVKGRKFDQIKAMYDNLGVPI